VGAEIANTYVGYEYAQGEVTRMGGRLARGGTLFTGQSTVGKRRREIGGEDRNKLEGKNARLPTGALRGTVGARVKGEGRGESVISSSCPRRETAREVKR